jgi:DNA end-binding protein Ku
VTQKGSSREHIIGLEPLDQGLMGTLLRYPYEVRNEHEYFDDIQDVPVTTTRRQPTSSLRSSRITTSKR